MKTLIIFFVGATVRLTCSHLPHLKATDDAAERRKRRMGGWGHQELSELEASTHSATHEMSSAGIFDDEFEIQDNEQEGQGEGSGNRKRGFTIVSTDSDETKASSTDSVSPGKKKSTDNAARAVVERLLDEHGASTAANFLLQGEPIGAPVKQYTFQKNLGAMFSNLICVCQPGDSTPEGNS